MRLEEQEKESTAISASVKEGKIHEGMVVGKEKMQTWLTTQFEEMNRKILVKE